MPIASRTQVRKRYRFPGLILMSWALFPFPVCFAQAVPIPTPPPAPATMQPASAPGAPAAQPAQAGPDEAQAATSAADAEFLRWKAEQAKLAARREAAEVQRFSPLIAQSAQSGSREEIESLVEQIGNSRMLSLEAQTRLSSPLNDRLAILQSAAASTAVGNGDLLRARTLLTRARAAFDRVAPPAQSAAALTQAQAFYIEAICKAALSKAEESLETALADLSLARGILDLLAQPQGPAANAARAELKKTEEQIADLHVTQTIEHAKRAEAERNLRLALYLYEDAKRQGGDTQPAIDRIESARRSPLLEGGASFLVPGLGQAIGGRPLPAALFFVSTIGLAATGAYLTSSASDKYDRYLDSTTPASADHRYNAVRARWIGAELAFASAIIMHLWNTYDAYTDAQQFNRDHF